MHVLSFLLFSWLGTPSDDVKEKVQKHDPELDEGSAREDAHEARIHDLGPRQEANLQDDLHQHGRWSQPPEPSPSPWARLPREKYQS